MLWRFFKATKPRAYYRPSATPPRILSQTSSSVRKSRSLDRTPQAHSSMILDAQLPPQRRAQFPRPNSTPHAAFLLHEPSPTPPTPISTSPTSTAQNPHPVRHETTKPKQISVQANLVAIVVHRRFLASARAHAGRTSADTRPPRSFSANRQQLSSSPPPARRNRIIQLHQHNRPNAHPRVDKHSAAPAALE